MKSAVTVILLLFVVGSIAFLVVGEMRAPLKPDAQSATKASQASHETPDAAPRPAGPADAQPAATIVYYFHGTMRCPTCLKMEQYAREAVEETFVAESDAGLIEWRAVDYDEPANEHFVKDFGLTASALVVAGASSGTAPAWRNLDRIWDLVNDEAAFKAYVVGEVTAMLRGDS